MDGGRVEVRPNIHSLSRVYIEPTSRCNLTCGTCIRNTWREPLGDMDIAVFDRLVAELGDFPTSSPSCSAVSGSRPSTRTSCRMIAAVKGLGPQGRDGH